MHGTWCGCFFNVSVFGVLPPYKRFSPFSAAPEKHSPPKAKIHPQHLVSGPRANRIALGSFYRGKCDAIVCACCIRNWCGSFRHGSRSIPVGRFPVRRVVNQAAFAKNQVGTRHGGNCSMNMQTHSLTMPYTRTSNSPLRSEFVACDGWR